MHPELGFNETYTAAKVTAVLEGLGMHNVRSIGTGVVAECGHGDPVVAVRTELDALPLQEANDVPYRSQVPGVMHACGHDAHMAIALGTAAALRLLGMTTADTPPDSDEAKAPDIARRRGTVRFLFQPAEEVMDAAGKSGAQYMIEGGALAGAQCVFALHMDPSLAAGSISVKAGLGTAQTGLFTTRLFSVWGGGPPP